MRHGSLFSGIGGFDLAAKWMGWENVFHCEKNEFCQKVLKYHYPNSISYDDIKETDFNIHRGRVDIISGGFPCQPFSQAGKRLGTEDDRYLWDQMLRAIREIQPTWVVGENVYGLVNWNEGMVFEQVQSDLEAEGYEVQSYVLPACGVNAPHRRDRIWIVAHCIADRGRPGSGFQTRGQMSEDGFEGAGSLSDSECDGHDGDEVTSEGQQYDGRGSSRGESPSHGESHDASHTEGRGPGRLRNQGEKEGSRDSDELSGEQCGVSGAEGVVPDTDHPGGGIGVRADRDGQKKNKRRKGQPQPEFREDGIDEDVADTESMGRGRRRSEEVRSDRHEDGLREGLSDIERLGESGDVAHTEQSGSQGDELEELPGPRGKEQGGAATESSEAQDWSEWPTESPFHSRDDGFSSRLSGVTVPAHRRESIKAYGNAVVPQVVMQIFKTIEEYEQDN